jgi:hypothetical protein
MRTIIALPLLVVLLVLSTSAPLAAEDKIPASGDFTAIVDFATLSLTPVGANCRLEVDGKLVFNGTLEGEAIGTTQALVLAPCADVGSNPPGTFKDVFKSQLIFNGTVDGIPATAEMTYQGITEVGGNIEAHLLLKNGLKGNLDVQAVVAVGGSYEGFVRFP